MNHKLYAAIDIGTNAGRILIGKVVMDNGVETVQQIQLVRAPLRLGADVFDTGNISEAMLKKLILTLRSFKLLALAYGIRKIKVYATSALRESDNRDYILGKVKDKTKLKIELIDGNREAELIFKSFRFSEFQDKSPRLFIDVGGGSTELTILKGDRQVTSGSFRIGTVRMLKEKVESTVWDDIGKWLDDNNARLENASAIGTGGNINKLSQIARKRYLEPVTIEELKETSAYLASMSLDERIENMRLNPDRADVIIPASEIYIRIMEMAGIDHIFVPKMGLTDGMIIEQYHNKKMKTS